MIEGLSQKGQQLYNFLLKGAKEGRTGADVLRALRKEGLGYRMQEFYHDYRLVKASVGKWDSMKYTPHNRIIPSEYYVKAKSPLKRNYMTTIYVRCIRKDTGEIVDRYVTIFHDRQLTRGELEQKAVAQINYNAERDIPTSKGLEPVEAFPVKAFRSLVEWVS